MEESVARPYQLELLEAALEENTIVNLGTGAGKTFIAVMLIKELSPAVLKSWNEEGSKRTIFLVTSVPLVKQQAEYIGQHTLMNVGQYIGAMNVDDWTEGDWEEQFEKNHILVMTMTIFKNLLLRNILQFRQVNLLVFDECHHAVKNHEYVQIMKRYKDSCDVLEPTHFLGLTASIIPSKCKPGDLKRKIEELERTLCSRAQTARDFSEVAKYATNPKEDCKYFSPSSRDRNLCCLKMVLDEVLSFLGNFPKQLKETEIYQMIKLNFDDCFHILTNLGIWCAHQYSCKALDDIADEISECRGYFSSREEEMLIHLGHTKMKVFKTKSSSLATVRYDNIHMTDKVHKVILHLGDAAAVSGEINGSPLFRRSPNSNGSRNSNGKLRGIIFTERRTTAVLLRDLLQKQSRECPDLKHICCDCVVGHNETKTGTYLRREARMNIKRQEDVLSKFRQGTINLLVSTSVVEEGVDVPKCNLVIRFDFPQNLRSYVQSKGRARAKESQYLLLIPDDEKEKLEPQLREYNLLVKELETVCHGRHVADDEAILKQLRDKVEPYRNTFGATATIDSSLSLVHKYCQKLPKDSFTVLSPNFTTKKRSIIEGMTEPNPYRIPNQNEEFKTTLTLPMSSLVKHPIEGEWFPSKRLADKSAALCVVRELDEAGELDEYLEPVVREEDSGDEEDMREEKSRPHAGTQRANSYYRNKVPPALMDCHPVCGVDKNYLYILLVTDKVTGNMHYSFPEHVSQLSFGILSSKPLPYLKIPEFSIFEEDKEYNVQVIRYHMKISLDRDELELLKLAHQAIFSEVLRIKPACLKPILEKNEKNYLVTPVQVFLPETFDGHPASSQLEVIIDFESSHLLAELIRRVSDPNNLFQSVLWPIPPQSFRNTIIVANHDPQKRLHEVTEVSGTITFSSPFDDSKVAATFRSYFFTRYGITCKDDKQPALECKVLGTTPSYLQLLQSRFKRSAEEGAKKSDKRFQKIKLFPELCSFYPLPANLWKLARCLPSILWRVESFLAIDSFRCRILQETGMGLCSDGSELTTAIKVTGYKDLGAGQLKSQRYVPEVGEEEAKVFSSFDCNPMEQPLRSPDNALLLQALTTKSAMDCVDLERLETLGDSFLKFSTTVFLYCDRLDAHEGRLTNARSRRVENFNLFSLAKCKGIPDFILSKTFDPREMWIPPGFHFASSCKESHHNMSPSSTEQPRTASSLTEEEKNYLYHKLTDKGVADGIESLIGAYLVSGGILAGLKLMEWMGIKITPPNQDEMASLSSLEEGEIRDNEHYGVPVGSSPPGIDYLPQISLAPSCFARPPQPKQPKRSPGDVPLFIANSAATLKAFFCLDKRLKTPELSKQEKIDLNRLLHIALGEKKFENFIGWKFKNRSLLLQALTHASYTRNRLTDSYQRLEFLGDAILDYLVTCHIYKRFPEYNPGQISCMRSALVDNISFADHAVHLKLHTVLLHNSPALMKQIDLFLKHHIENDIPPDCNETFYEPSSSTSNHEEEGSEGSSAAHSGGELDPAYDFDEEVEDISPPKVLGDILESLAGAIFIDSGFSLESVWNIFQPHFDQKIDSFKGAVPIPPIQQLRQVAPSASLECKKDGKKSVCYVISVLREGAPSLRVCARGRTKVAAKNAAAKVILRKIKDTSN